MDILIVNFSVNYCVIFSNMLQYRCNKGDIMNRTAKCIKMLEILSSGEIVKKTELAQKLGVEVRNIVEYRRQLEEAGYRGSIETIKGKNGGYRLISSATIPVAALSKEEKEALVKGVEILNQKEEFVEKDLFNDAVSKINLSSNKVQAKEVTVIETKKLLMPKEEIQKRYDILTTCIEKKKKCKIKFLSSDNVVRDRLIHPYKTFIYNGAWFVVGYCEMVEGVRPFKLNRIEQIEKTTESFKVKRFYSEKDYFDEKGFKQGRDWADKNNQESASWFHIKLKLSGRPAMYVKEYRYGDKQKIVAIDQNTTILECDMQFKYNIKQFVLGFGADCEVIEPQWLNDEIKEECLKIINRQ